MFALYNHQHAFNFSQYLSYNFIVNTQFYTNVHEHKTIVTNQHNFNRTHQTPKRFEKLGLQNDYFYFSL